MLKSFFQSLPLLLLLSSPCSADQGAPDALVTELSRLAGPSSTECGTVRLHADRNSAIECAGSAKSAYWLAIQLQGIDSLIWQGVARDTQGKVWAVWYDSDITGGRENEPLMNAVPCRKVSFSASSGKAVECEETSEAWVATSFNTTVPDWNVKNVSRDLEGWHNVRQPACRFGKVVGAVVIKQKADRITEHWTVEACNHRLFNYQVLVIRNGTAISDVVGDIESSQPGKP